MKPYMWVALGWFAHLAWCSLRGYLARRHTRNAPRRSYYYGAPYISGSIAFNNVIELSEPMHPNPLVHLPGIH